MIFLEKKNNPMAKCLSTWEWGGLTSIWLFYCAGYPSFKGQVLNGQQLWDLIEGLEANDLLYYTHLLTGTIVYDDKEFSVCII